jgi:hypothetical protein
LAGCGQARLGTVRHGNQEPQAKNKHCINR